MDRCGLEVNEAKVPNKRMQNPEQRPFLCNEKGFMSAVEMNLMVYAAIVMVILAVAIPQCKQYKAKKYDADALIDLRNARDCITAYARHHEGVFPESLTRASAEDKAACRPPSEAITLEYKRTTVKEYEITATHNAGNTTYKLIDHDEAVYYRFNTTPEMNWQKR